MSTRYGTTTQLFTYAILASFIQSINAKFTSEWNYALSLSGNFVKRAGLSETGIVRLIVAFLLFAILFPIAMSQITSATTTAWNPAVATVFAVLTPILVVLAAALGFFAVVESRGGI
jgi:hypothetical protein